MVRDDYDPEPDPEGEEPATVRCPECRRSFAEDAELCPYCGRAILAEDRTRRPWWVIVAAVILLILTGLGILGKI